MIPGTAWFTALLSVLMALGSVFTVLAIYYLGTKLLLKLRNYLKRHHSSEV